MIRERLWGAIDPYADAPAYAPDVQGWRTDHPLLRDAAARARRICEVGVWKGAGLVEMAAASPHAELLAVDHWRGASEHWLRDKWRRETREIDLYGLFKRNMIDAGLTARVTPLPLDSANAAIVCRRLGLTFDMIHIDGAHDFEAVARDLMQWDDLCTGVIVMDDYAPEWPGVVKATDEHAARSGWKLADKHRGKALLQRT